MREYLNDSEMSELAVDEHPQVQRLSAVIRGLSQEFLLLRMRELGLRYLGAADAPGLDMALWKAVVEAPVRLTDEEAAELEQISQQAGGWWRLGEGPEFMDLDSWASFYAQGAQRAL